MTEESTGSIYKEKERSQMPGTLYDIDKFLKSVADKGRLDIIQEARSRGQAAEHASFGVKGAVERRRQGSVEFAQCLKGPIFLLETR